MPPEKLPKSVSESLTLRFCLQTGIWLAIMAVLLLGIAQNWNWPQGWAFLAIFAAGSGLFGAWLLRHDPALLNARLGALNQKGQPWWDKLFLLIFVPAWLAWMGLMAKDAQVWRFSHMPLWLNMMGGLLVILGFAGVMLVFRENSFAAPVVRVQTERAQKVIDSGPYALVRHPMYAAALLYLLGTPLLLGSWLGLAAMPLIIAGRAPRAVLEERMLKRDLPGYAEYMTEVRYRLIPGIW